MSDIGVIHVWPGLIIDEEPGKLTIKLTRMTGESGNDFVKRCQDIANFALSKVPPDKPEVIDFSDTTKFRQVGPNSYEAIIPE